MSVSRIRPLFDERSLTPTQVRSRLRPVPRRALLKGLVDCVRAGLVNDVNAPIARVALRVAVERGDVAPVAALAADPALCWWARGAAAGALSDAGKTDARRGAGSLEALVFASLQAGKLATAREAARTLTALHPGATAAIERIDGWRAACLVGQGEFWHGDAEHGRDVAALVAEVDASAWIDPPNCLDTVRGHLVVRPRRPGEGGGDVASIVTVVLEGGLVTRLKSIALVDGEQATALEADRRACGAALAPAGEVAAMIRDGLRRRPSVPADDGTTRVVWLATRVQDDVAGPLPTDAEAVRLLQRPDTLATWAFDDIDLSFADPEVAASSGLDLDFDQLGPRVAAAARHTARWWRWRGDPVAAAAWAAMAEDAERDWRESVLKRTMDRMSVDRVVLPASAAPGAPEALRVARDKTQAGLDAFVDGIASAFEASPEGVARKVEGSSLAWATVVTTYSMAVAGATPLAWSPWLLRDHVLGTLLPEQATATGRDAKAILGDVRAFVAFLRHRWGLPQGEALERALGPDLDRLLAARLDDATAWRPEKAAMVRVREAGVDLSDLEAVAAFLDDDPELARWRRMTGQLAR